jgi:uncharacterized membrane protein HdeD (DUF308 family)
MLLIFQKYRKWLLTEGIIFLILGALAIALPLLFTMAVTLLFALFLIIGGVVGAIRLTNMGHFSGKWADWLFVIALLLTGILMFISPERGALTLTALLIAFFILSGIAKISLAFQSRDLPKWGWILVSGLLSLALAGVIIAGWPGASLWILGLLFGINMFFFGLVTTAIALSLKHKNRVE